MRYRKDCIWYDETRSADWHLCYCCGGERYCAQLDECPRNCRNYISKKVEDKELRELFSKKVATG